MKKTQKEFTKKEEKNFESYNKEEANDLGDHQAEIFENAQGMPVLYVKTIKKYNGDADPDNSIFLEVLAYRFINRFLPQQISAETNFFETLTGEMSISSNWINNYIPIYEASLPYAQDGAFRVNINGESRILQGNFFNNLLFMRFIGLGDSIGKGANTGYVLNEDGTVTLAQIDFGGGFAFANYEDYNPLNSLSLHIIQRFNKKYIKEYENDPDYITFIPLEMYNANEEDLIDTRFQLEESFLTYYEQDYNIRDLLFGFYTYKEIRENEFLYSQFLEALLNVLNITSEQISSLVEDDMPSAIAGEDLQPLKDNIVVSLFSRQAVIRQIYFEALLEESNNVVLTLMDDLSLDSVRSLVENRLFNQLVFIEKSTGITPQEEVELLLGPTVVDSLSSDEEEDDINFILEANAQRSWLNNLLDMFGYCSIEETGHFLEEIVGEIELWVALFYQPGAGLYSELSLI